MRGKEEKGWLREDMWRERRNKKIKNKRKEKKILREEMNGERKKREDKE